MASIKKRPNGSWRARFRDEAGKEHARHFDRKVDAQRWIDETTASIVTGAYVDPNAGRMTVKTYGEHWRGAQVHRPSSAAHVKTVLDRHVYPALGDKPLAAVLPSDVQAWARRLSESLAPSTVHVVHGILASIFKAAMRDRRVAATPCEGTKLPTRTPTRVDPLTMTTVEALAESVPDNLRAFVLVAASTGLRQGELFGLTLDRVDFLRRTLTVDRQVVTLKGGSHLGPPKTSRSHRTIPLPAVAVAALAAHLKKFPAQTVELPYRLDGTTKVVPAALVFSDQGHAWTRSAFGYRWRLARTAAKAPDGTSAHDLRHFYASLLIRHGESVKTVQARLGHATAAETLDTYAHLWPDSDDRTREAIDEAFANPAADSVRTGEVSG